MAEQKIQVLARAFRVIEYLAEHKDGVGITDLANKTKLGKSSVYRVVDTLRDLGYVVQDQASDKYALSLKFVQLSSMLLNQTELKVVAYPHLRRLSAEVSQTTHLCVLRGTEAVYLEKIVAYSHSVRMYSEIGLTVPVYCSAVGKCLVAWLPQNQQEEILKDISFKPRTEYTITNLEQYKKELVFVQNNGYSIDDLENEEGVRCVAAPIRDYTGDVIAAMSVSGNYESIETDEFRKSIERVTCTAAQISQELGFFEQT